MLGLGWKPFKESEEREIIAAIKDAEKRTSGEIRVHIDKWCKTDPAFKAQNKFMHFQMHDTKERNGVLIYLALLEHKVAIIGDQGIDEKVEDGFWKDVKDLMIEQFKQGRIVEGLCMGIRKSGEKLSIHFPYQDDDENELPDEISYG